MPVWEASRLGQSISIKFLKQKPPVWLHTSCLVFTELQARTGFIPAQVIILITPKRKKLSGATRPRTLGQFSSLLKRKKMPVWLHTSVGYYNYFCTFAPEIEFYYRAHP